MSAGESLPDDPFQLLGVAPGVSALELKRAYASAIKRYRPEKHPQEFQRLRSAYVFLKAYCELPVETTEAAPPAETARPESPPREPECATRNEAPAPLLSEALRAKARGELEPGAEPPHRAPLEESDGAEADEAPPVSVPSPAAAASSSDSRELCRRAEQAFEHEDCERR